MSISIDMSGGGGFGAEYGDALASTVAKSSRSRSFASYTRNIDAKTIGMIAIVVVLCVTVVATVIASETDSFPSPQTTSGASKSHAQHEKSEAPQQQNQQRQRHQQEQPQGPNSQGQNQRQHTQTPPQHQQPKVQLTEEQIMEAEVTSERRKHVKSMMADAWSAYSEHAFGYNELKPVSRKGHSPQYFGSLKGASLVDALDTLILMNMTKEVAQARSWIEHDLVFDGIATVQVSTFEVCIRFLGGLLSAFALTGDVLYKDKALDLGRRLIPAFDTPTGLPMSTIDLATGATGSWSWAPGGCSILSEVGTMSLEFIYLSRITGDDIFADKVNTAMTRVFDDFPDCGLFPNYIHPQTGKWGPNETSVGALGDSFYEYLYKTWVLEGKPQDDLLTRARYERTMRGVSHLVHTSKQNNVYIAETKNGVMQHKMGHLACFMGGLYALSADDAPTVGGCCIWSLLNGY